jgi:hypothetical protein
MSDRSKDAEQKTCPLCESKFVPQKDQREAQFCSGTAGFVIQVAMLCEACEEVAEAYGVFEPSIPPQCVPPGYMILQKSRTCTPQRLEKLKSEMY